MEFSFDELTPEKCRELREGGIVELDLIAMLHHEKSQVQSETDFNMDKFLMNFDRKSAERREYARKLRIIVENSALNDSEVPILDCLEAVRVHTEELYFAISKGVLTEFSDIPLAPYKEIYDLIEFSFLDTNSETVELFGGVFVILNYLRAQTRFYSKCIRFSEQLQSIEHHRYQLLEDTICILLNLISPPMSRKDLRAVLGQRRWLHEWLMWTIQDAHDENDDDLVRQCCRFIHCLNFNDGDNDNPPEVIHEHPYMRECGLIECLAFMATDTPDDPETLYWLLMALSGSETAFPVAAGRLDVLQLCSVRGFVEFLIDVLVSSPEKYEDAKNAKWHDGARFPAMRLLCDINRVLLLDDQDGQLVTLLVDPMEHDIVPVLTRHLQLITSTKYPLELLLALLWIILHHSKDQRQKFARIEGAREMIQRFKRSTDADRIVELAKNIMELL